MDKRKVWDAILLSLTIVFMLSCAAFFMACTGPVSEDGSQNIEQEVENEQGTNQGGDREEPDLEPDENKDEEPQEIDVISVSLDKTELTLGIGENYTLTATVLPNNATDKSVVWESMNEQIVKVVDGQLSANAIGQTTIIALAGNGKKAQCIVKVEKFVTNLFFSRAEYYVEVGADYNFNVYYLPTDATKIKGEIQYTVSDESILRRNTDGSYTALKAGTVEITVSNGEGLSASCIVNCYVIEVTGITFSSSSGWDCLVGESGYLIYSISPYNATDQTVKWKSSDNSVVTVREDGLVEVVGPGTAIITVTAPNGVSASKTVNAYHYTLELPDFPLELQNTSNPAYFVTEEATITDIEYEFNASSSWLKVKIKGTKTYDLYGGSHVFKINYKVVNTKTNVVVEGGTFRSNSISAGESFVIDETIYVFSDDIVESGNYKLVLSGVAW